MKILNEIKGLKTYVRDDSLLVQINNKYSAWGLRNRVELMGYSVNLEQNKDHYILRVWGADLRDKYLLRNEVFAA